MLTAPSPPAGPPWVQILLSAVGILGGLGGAAAIATVWLQRKKFRADAADVITDTALTLVEPLKTRVSELQSEVRDARHQAKAANAEVAELRSAVREMTRILARWHAAIFAPDATIDRLRVMASTDPTPSSNGVAHHDGDRD
ncbi:hypothetical protein AB0B94_30745 [Micromonospora sp. NPDC048986]|uniref:hypothetical protein n=1 Tax=Micromonospora sp. NPDC048986 TaxID=3155644 RepID=UPI0033E4E6E4